MCNSYRPTDVILRKHIVARWRRIASRLCYMVAELPPARRYWDTTYAWLLVAAKNPIRLTTSGMAQNSQQYGTFPRPRASAFLGARRLPQPELIVIGGSAGALKPVLELARELPADLPAAVCIVIHTSPDSPGRLAEIVQRAVSLPCKYPDDGEILRPAHIYVAPADRHLLVEPGRLRLTRGPRENGFRPAIDPLFRTAAQCYGPRVAGVVLSGSLDDGAYGLAVIKQAGGMAIVQDPDDAVVPSMPRGALRVVDVDHVATSAELGPLIARLCAPTSAPAAGAASFLKARNPHISLAGAAMSTDVQSPDPAERGTDLTETTPPGELTPLTCPECGGSLWQAEHGRQLRFACHVGHAFSADGLMEYHSRAVEGAMWTALRVLEEHAALQKRLADRARQQEFQGAAEQFERRSEETRRQAQSLRGVLLSRPRPAPEQAGPMPESEMDSVA